MPARRALLMPASWLLALLPMPAAAVELAGRTVPPYPGGLQDVGGACVSDSPDPAHVCDFSIGVLADAAAGTDDEPALRYVVAGRMAGRDGTHALWKITDVLPYPTVGRGYSWQAGSCRVDQVDDGKVIALVNHSAGQEYLTDIAWARRLDLHSGKFSVLDPARVDCLNEGFGEF